MTACEPQIIGTSQAILKVRQIILKVADVDLNVLISGESGVGKELVARALHYYSGRREKPFMKVNCAALPRELMETELFGYEKGAFTGADRRRIGKPRMVRAARRSRAQRTIPSRPAASPRRVRAATAPSARERNAPYPPA
jgi:transcriptional regulator with GAF, ATPase, and Fis domain